MQMSRREPHIWCSNLLIEAAGKGFDIVDQRISAGWLVTTAIEEFMDAMSIDINHPASSQLEYKETSTDGGSGANIELLDSAAASPCNVPIPNSNHDQLVSTCSIENHELKNTLEQRNCVRTTSGNIQHDHLLLNERHNDRLNLSRSLDSDNVMPSDGSPLGKASGIKHIEKSTLNTDNNMIDIEHQEVHYSKLASSGSCIPLKRNSCLKQLTTNEGRAHEPDNVNAPQDKNDVLPEKIIQDMAKVNGSPPERNEENLDKKKDEITFCKGDVSASLPDDNPESVESNNYKQLLFIEKRSSMFQSDGSPGSSKRIKKVNDVVCSKPFPMQGSSFLNWMTNVAQSYHAVAQKPHNTKLINSSILPSSEAIECFNYETKSFQPFVETLCHPDMKPMQQTTGGTIVHPLESGNCKELKVAEKPSPFDCNEQFLNKEGFKVFNSFPLSGKKIGETQLSEFSPTSVPSSGCDKLQALATSNHVSIENHLESSGDSKQNDSIANNTGCSGPIVSCNGGQFLESFWITRLRQKAALKNNETCDQKATLFTEMQVNDVTGCLPLSKDVNMLLLAADQMENINNLPLKDGKNASTSLHHHVTPSESCVPEGMYTDPKPKPNCNLSLPSHRLRKPEPMASVFAKRLDALRHIEVSGIVDDFMFSTITCFYCGRSGHYLKECTEIADSERDDLLKKCASFAKPQNASCFCIQCFRLNHWAIACPYVPIKIAQPSRGSVFQMNNLHSESGKPPDGICVVDHEPKMCSNKVEIRGRVRNPFESHYGTTSSFNAGHLFVANSKDGEINMILDSKSSDNPTSESEKHIMQIAPFIDNNKESEIKGSLLVHDSAIKRIPEKARIFDRVRGLRLSRTDLSSGIKSPLNSCLKGFFLRVRLGKWQEGIGGTGYHVACITGAISRKLHEKRCKVEVNIGGLKLSLDCRFISNHDFIEDELHAWWTQTLQNGERLPSEEELTRKLQERRDFNF